MKDVKIFTKMIEPEAEAQINELASLPAFSNCKIRIMPDVHAGAGCVIGFTGDLGEKVIPNIVGVDIGCGMLCARMKKANFDLQRLDEAIKRIVPAGREIQQEPQFNPELLEMFCLSELKGLDRIAKSLGSLGGANHFIEVDEDEDGDQYLIIHTGSRNLGKQVAEIYQQKAIEYCSFSAQKAADKEKIIASLKEQNRQQDIPAALQELDASYRDKTGIPDNLCYLEGELREHYLHDMRVCQEFAKCNRELILSNILEEYYKDEIYCLPHCFHTVHNYIDFSDNIVRKGAIAARAGEEVLIPLNMRDGCILGVGKGNPEWNCSAPHGAGRAMSRRQAKENIQLADFQKSMEGIFTTTADITTIDEAPAAYKPMENIVDNITETVEIKKILKPIYNFKASSL